MSAWPSRARRGVPGTAGLQNDRAAPHGAARDFLDDRGPRIATSLELRHVAQLHESGGSLSARMSFEVDTIRHGVADRIQYDGVAATLRNAATRPRRPPPTNTPRMGAPSARPLSPNHGDRGRAAVTQGFSGGGGGAGGGGVRSGHRLQLGRGSGGHEGRLIQQFCAFKWCVQCDCGCYFDGHDGAMSFEREEGDSTVREPEFVRRTVRIDGDGQIVLTCLAWAKEGTLKAGARPGLPGVSEDQLLLVAGGPRNPRSRADSGLGPQAAPREAGRCAAG